MPYTLNRAASVSFAMIARINARLLNSSLQTVSWDTSPETVGASPHGPEAGREASHSVAVTHGAVKGLTSVPMTCTGRLGTARAHRACGVISGNANPNPLNPMKPQALARKIARMEARARRLWSLRRFPDAPEYAIAERLWNEAQKLKKP